MEPLQFIFKYAICYAVFFLLSFISKLNGGHKLFDQKGTVSNTGALTGLQIAGILWLGVIPANIFDQSFSSVIMGSGFPGALKLTVLILLIINAVIIAATQAENEFTRIESQKTAAGFFTKGFMYRYFTVRILFLIAYEAWFRGYLLRDCTISFGIIPAVLINVFLYMLVHCFSDRNEMWGCVPLGIVLCTMSIWFGGAWPAIVIHLALAITYEFKLSEKCLHLKNSFA